MEWHDLAEQKSTEHETIAVEGAAKLRALTDAANQLAQDTCKQALIADAGLERAIAAIHEIDVASRRVAQMFSVLDEIAFQTNLLALNDGLPVGW